MSDIPFDDPRHYLLEDHPEDPDEPCQICSSSVLGESIAAHAANLESIMGYDPGRVLFHSAAELLNLMLISGVFDRKQLPELIDAALDEIAARSNPETGDIRHIHPAGQA